MPRSHNLLRLIAIACLLTVLTGCWNYREISDMTFIAGAGIDLDPAGGYLLTLETVDFSAASPEPRLITTAAPTITQAVEKAERSVSSRLYWDHAAVVVLGRTLAESGIGGAADYILANLDTALNVWLLVAEEGSAQEIFGLGTQGAAVVSMALAGIMQDNPYFGQTIPERLYEILPALTGGAPTLLAAVSGVSQNDEETLSVSGCAVMSDGRLAATLDGEQTAAALALRGELSEHVLQLPHGAVRLLGVERRLDGEVVRVDAGYAVAEGEATADEVAAALEAQLAEVRQYAEGLGMDILGIGEDVSVVVSARPVRGTEGPGMETRKARQ